MKGTAMTVINVGKDFSRTPGGRYIKDGPDSGQLFRDRMLIPKLKQAIAQNDKLTVELDGPRGYLASFLEEAFGGLVRHGHFTQSQLKEILAIEAHDLFYAPYKTLALRAIADARSESIARAS